MTRRVLAFLAAAMLLVPLLAHEARTADDASPSAPVERLTAGLLETMKNAQELGFEGRFDKLSGDLPEVFAFDFMARLSIGRHWSKLDEAQQDAFADTFARMSIATFAARFDGYSGQTFKVLAPRSGPRGTVLVPTRLTKPDGGSVGIDYLMRQFDDGWRAIDVYLDSKYSELATKRSEYSSVISREGYAALIGLLEKKIADLRADSSQG